EPRPTGDEDPHDPSGPSFGRGVIDELLESRPLAPAPAVSRMAPKARRRPSGGEHLFSRTTLLGRAEADARAIQKSLEVARNRVEPAVAVVPPAHPDLLDAVPLTPGQVENLDVEDVAVDSLASEQVAGHVGSEDLKAALRIRDVPKSDDRVHPGREGTGAEPPVPCLWHLDRRPRGRA